MVNLRSGHKLCAMLILAVAQLSVAEVQAPSIELTSAEMNSRILEAAKLLKKSNHAKACSILDSLPARGNEWDQLSLNVQFLLGQCHAGLGLYKEASGYFEKVVKYDPQEPRPHLDLALIYQYQGEYGAAKEQYDTLLDMDLTPKVRGNIKHLVANRPDALQYHIDLSAGLIVDSNVNNGPETENIEAHGVNFPFNIESRPISASGNRLKARFRADKLLNRTSKMATSLSATNTAFDQSGTYDTNVLDLNISYHKKKGGAEYMVKPAYTAISLGGEPLVSIIGVDGSLATLPKNDVRLTTTLGYQNFSYDRNPDNNNQLFKSQLLLSYHYNPKLIFGTEIGLGLASATDPANSYTDLSLGLKAGYALTPPLLFSFSYQLNATSYDGKSAAFNKARNDIRTRMILGMSYNLKEWSMQRFTIDAGVINYSNSSNIELYTSERNQLYLTLSVAI